MLEWDYIGRTVDILMPGYIKMILQEYKFIMPNKLQTCPYSPEPKIFGTEAQAPLPPDLTPKLDAKGIKCAQKIVGSILYYAQAVNMAVLMALSYIVVKQMKATEKTMEQCTQLLDYLLGHAGAKVRFPASDMILNIHSDVSYLLEAKTCSRACGHFFMGWMPQDGKPICLNGAFHVSTTIFAFCCRLCRQSRIRCTLPQLPDRDYFLTHPHRHGHLQPKNPSIATTPWR